MRKSIIIGSAVLVALACSCKKSDIPVYQLGDSAVCFPSTTNNFSLRGMEEQERDLTIKVTLIGPKSEEDRPIAYEIEEVSAHEGTDFTVVSAEVPAGALSGVVVLRVKKLPEGVGSRAIRFTIKPNEHFREGYAAYLQTDIAWTENYERPVEGVWRYWWLYISNTYSRDFHKLLVQTYGDEIETYTCSKAYVRDNENLVYKLPTWWFSVNHEFREIVRKHDLENPGNPYRHSADAESYRTYTLGVGAGEKYTGDVPPTILETLNNI